MENAVTLAALMGPIYLVVGLSLLVHAKSWHTLLGKWAQDHYVLFPFMFAYIVLGLISVRMYNVWEWNLWLLVTITGWGLLVKGVFYMLAPGSWVVGLLTWKANKNLLHIGSVATLVIGAVLSYYVYFA